MNHTERTRLSKTLSYVLRHRPDAVGIMLDEAGWTDADELIDALIAGGTRTSREQIDEVVQTNPKRRFEFSADGTRIRARQGHSVPVDLGYEPVEPPAVLYHGTAERNVESILAHGLHKAKRHHVHMSTDRTLMIEVARRHGAPVLIAIDAARMHGDGHTFFKTENDVWLTDTVPPKYLRAEPA